MEESTIKCLLSREGSCGLSKTGSKLLSFIIDPEICGSECVATSLSDSVFSEAIIRFCVTIVANQAETPQCAFEDQCHSQPADYMHDIINEIRQPSYI